MIKELTHLRVQAGVPAYYYMSPEIRHVVCRFSVPIDNRYHFLFSIRTVYRQLGRKYLSSIRQSVRITLDSAKIREVRYVFTELKLSEH